jgi:hypothetical protein
VIFHSYVSLLEGSNRLQWPADRARWEFQQGPRGHGVSTRPGLPQELGCSPIYGLSFLLCKWNCTRISCTKNDIWSSQAVWNSQPSQKLASKLGTPKIGWWINDQSLACGPVGFPFWDWILISLGPQFCCCLRLIYNNPQRDRKNGNLENMAGNLIYTILQPPGNTFPSFWGCAI